MSRFDAALLVYIRYIRRSYYFFLTMSSCLFNYKFVYLSINNSLRLYLSKGEV